VLDDDPALARRLEQVGCAAHAGRLTDLFRARDRNPHNISLIVERTSVPVILLDAGIGTSSDAMSAMELGCKAVLVASAVTRAADPVRIARAIRLAVHAGRTPTCPVGYRGAGGPRRRPPTRAHSTAS
jgi:thiazole synthase